MIIQIRVDDRLVHGQIALVWSKALGTDRIVVANDKTAVTEATQMALKMAVPNGIKLLIRNVDEAITLFNNPKAKDVGLFVLVNTVSDAYKIVEKCSDVVKAVNIANVGKFDGVPMKEKKAFLDGFFTEKEIEACKELLKFDIPVYHQITPEKPQISVEKALTELN